MMTFLIIILITFLEMCDLDCKALIIMMIKLYISDNEDTDY